MNGFYVNVTDARQELQMTAEDIGRYLRRPPVSEESIYDYTGEYVTLGYKDYRTNRSKVRTSLKPIKFI